MLVREMHIEVARQIQQLQTNVNRKLYSQEIDWELNKAQEEMVRDEVEPLLTDGKPINFDLHKLRKIDALITYEKSLISYLSQGSPFVFAPTNCMYPLALRGKLLLACDQGFDTSTVNSTLNIWTLKLAPSTGKPLYENLKLYVGDDVIFSHPGITSESEIFELQTLMIDALHRAGLNAVFETGLGLYAFQSIIIFSLNDVPDIRVTHDGSVNTIATATTRVLTNYSATGFSQGIDILKPSLKRFIEGDPFYSAVGRHMYLFYHPIDPMRVYLDESGILTSLDLTYIRKPRKINLILNINSELPDTVHQEICNRAALNIMKYSGNQLYQAIAQDINKP